MTAPALPLNPRSPAADDLLNRLTYMEAVRALMSDAPKPGGQMGTLSKVELRIMERYFVAGVPAETFVARVKARRCRWCHRRTPSCRKRTGFCSDMCNLERYGAATKEDM